MMMTVILVYILLLLGTPGDGQGNSKYCQVCRVLISEVEWLISQVDPKKSIQVGSFRVDPSGNQKIKDKQYARSETHLEEIFETVCDRMLQYAEIKFEDKTSQMVRTVGFNRETLETEGFKLDKDKGKTFRYQCDNFIENHEEEIIALLQLENVPDYEKLICGDKIEVCTRKELWNDLFRLPVKKRTDNHVVMNYFDIKHGDIEADSDEDAVDEFAEDDVTADDSKEAVNDSDGGIEGDSNEKTVNENDDSLSSSEDVHDKTEL